MKKMLLYLLATLSTIAAKAQYEPQWQLGHPEFENFCLSASTAFTDGYAMLGSFTDTIMIGGTVMVSHGGTDIMLVQLDTLGVIKNAISFGNEHDDNASYLFNHNDTLFICGQTITDSISELFIYSFDNTFHKLSELAFPFEGKVQTDKIIVTPNKLILGGSMKGRILIGSHMLINESDEHAYYAELSREGEFVSSWQTSGNGLHRLHSLVLTSNGDRVLMLNTGKGNLEMPDVSSLLFKETGAVLAQYDSVWNVKSHNVFYCTGYVEATDLIGNEAGYVIGLNYKGILTFDKQTFSSQNSFSSLLIQFDTEGNTIWIREIGSNDYCRLLDIETEGENIVCTGYYYGKLLVEDEVLEETVDRNSFLVVFDNDGRLSCYVDMDCVGDNMGLNSVCNYNGVMINGICQTNNMKNTFGNVPLNNCAFAHKYVFTAGSFENPKEDSVTTDNEAIYLVTNQPMDNTPNDNPIIEIFPNPVKNVMYWNTHQTGRWMLELFDVRGVLLTRKRYSGCSEGNIDLSFCKSGIYIIKITSTEKSGQHVIIKL